jgi:hypothetical protein
MNRQRVSLLALMVGLGGCASHSPTASATPAPAGHESAVALPVAASAPASPAGSAARVALADTITEASVRGHMDFLASDALSGRGSGTRDEWIAATYMAAQMRRWGIEPLGDNGGYVQAVEVSRTETAAPPVLVIGSRRFTHGKEILVQALGAPRVTGVLQTFDPATPVGPGAIVLVPDGVQPQPAAIAAAAAVLAAETPMIRSRWESAASRPVGGASRLTALPESPAAPRPSRIVLDKDAYAAALGAAGAMVAFEADVRVANTSTWNAIGRLTGSDPAMASDVILLSAHLDHLGSRGSGPDPIYNGADDDASGSVAVLELAEGLARGPRPKRTVMFVWFGSEEAGGHGARLFVERPPVPLDRIVANLEFEMIGRADPAVPPHALWLTGYERTNLGPALARRGAKIVADPHPEQNFFMRSDNIQLARKGVVAQTVSSFNLHKEYHTPADEIRMIDFAHMTDSIRSMVEPVRWLANDGFKPEWVAGKRP